MAAASMPTEEAIFAAMALAAFILNTNSAVIGGRFREPS